MSLGQTPFTMITKITKTAIALKTNSFDQKKNSKKFKEINIFYKRDIMQLSSGDATIFSKKF